MRYFVFPYIGMYSDQIHFGHEGIAQKTMPSFKQLSELIKDEVGFDDVLILPPHEYNAVDYTHWMAGANEN